MAEFISKSTRKSPSFTSLRLYIGWDCVELLIALYSYMSQTLFASFNFYFTQTHSACVLLYMSRPQLIDVRAPGPHSFYFPRLIPIHNMLMDSIRRGITFLEDPQSHDVCVCLLIKEYLADFVLTVGEGGCHCSWFWLLKFLVGYFC
jgi:hypothetical protein